VGLLVGLARPEPDVQAVGAVHGHIIQGQPGQFEPFLVEERLYRSPSLLLSAAAGRALG
jgi:hypothetical protein